MIALIRSEARKQSSTRTALGLLAAMLALVVPVALLHSLAGGTATELATRKSQLNIVADAGIMLATLFAALLGAISITGEYRYGTIRPTCLVSPRRGEVVAAKVCVSVALGIGFGIIGAGVAAGVGSAALAARGIPIALHSGDFALLVAGGAGGAALWAGIGVGVGALVRSQMPSLVGLCAWMLFVENAVLGELTTGTVGSIDRFSPVALAKASAGLDPRLAPGVALPVLVVYAAAAAAAGWWLTARRDLA